MKSRILVLLSGEGTALPEAEARALFLAYDPASSFEMPEKRILLAVSRADPLVIARRIAFARRVGVLVDDLSQAAAIVGGGTTRLRNFDLVKRPALNPELFLKSFEGRVDLRNPDYELSLIRGKSEFLALTSPGAMLQGWSRRRPRARSYFHPSAIFPKLARALVNLTRCTEGQVFLDPFCGTGSLPLEAALIGAQVVGLDRADAMVRGSLANMKHFGQRWLGVVRSDSLTPPLTLVDAVATDVPYGRASSTMGAGGRQVLERAVAVLPDLVRRGSRLVVMHRREDPILPSGEVSVEEEHDLHVHKKLTRRITVLRRR